MESRSSELLLRNGISDISVATDVRPETFVLEANDASFQVPLLDSEGPSTRVLSPVSEHTARDVNVCVKIIVSFMMTPAHVLRLASMPEPVKVDPLVLPWQQGDDLLGLPTV